MTKSEIFAKAHKITKAAVQVGDDYQVTFGAALKIVIMESKGADKEMSMTEIRNHVAKKVMALGLKRDSHIRIAFEYIGRMECGSTREESINQLLACNNQVTVNSAIRAIENRM